MRTVAYCRVSLCCLCEIVLNPIDSVCAFVVSMGFGFGGNSSSRRRIGKLICTVHRLRNVRLGASGVGSINVLHMQMFCAIPIHSNAGISQFGKIDVYEYNHRL